MLTPFDDYPVHQTSLPVAHVGNGHPDHFDRFWFNGYNEEMFFALAMGIYPNRGIIDAAFSVVHDDVQRSVFASGRVPLDRTRTRVGPISVEIVEPLRVNRIRVNAPEHGLVAELTAVARTAAFEEPRQTHFDGAYPLLDNTRATQMVAWTGQITAGGQSVPVTTSAGLPVVGSKDRSWGVRGLGDRIPMAPRSIRPQTFFLWAPLNFADECLHFMSMEDEFGWPRSRTAAVLPVVDDGGPVFGPDTGTRRLGDARHAVRWAPGLRRSEGATLHLGEAGAVELEPIRTFRMKGAGYLHPIWAHGKWHDELAVGGEVHRSAELDTLSSDCIHVQQVMRASWGEQRGLGVLEQLVIGPYAPGGFRDLFDGAPVRPTA
ncbi:hypothetical protein [Frankia sp. AgKG'84/4]|uniref:hypothetical protein n=1 Tax=Frankia sp. AgKG'84/4 TaxID=573490 RepID=UPI00200C37AD|nr:hypothetical protein [Frankia sp. AgKG'84/4]MCL9795459.1 hypothetical protein [Frankia sp. AgKG'84/4]